MLQNRSMPILYYYPSNASMAPHILLEELGIPFELLRVERERDAQKSPEYLRLNPNGLIPVLIDGDLVLYEAAAICLHLADCHPDAHLIPALGTRERAEAYKWLVWMTNTLQTALIRYFYPERLVDEGNADGVAQVKRHAEEAVTGLLQHLDAQISRAGGPWLLGGSYSLVDPYAFMLCRWTRGFDRAARDFEHLGPYLGRMLERPAVQRAIATEGLSEPFV